MAKLTEVQAASPIRKVAINEGTVLLHRKSAAGTNYIETRVAGQTVSCRRVTKEELAEALPQ